MGRYWYGPVHARSFVMLRRFLLSSSLSSSHEMAWLCSGNTNEELVQKMNNSGLFKSEMVAAVCMFSMASQPTLGPHTFQSRR